MVRILSNGDIVPDDDARLSQPSTSRGQEPTSNRQRGFVQNEPDPVRHMPQPDASIFDTMNNRLLEVGIPRWNLGPYVVEPIVTVALILALVLIGFKGLVLGLVLFFVCKWSTGGNQEGQGFRGWRGGNVGGAGVGQQGGRSGGMQGAMGMMGGAFGLGGGQGGNEAGSSPQSRGNDRGWSGGSGHRLGRS